jgi:CheY-like chemotaxis protein
MAVVSIFAGAYCDAETVARAVAGKLGHPLRDDEAAVQEAARRFPIGESALRRTLMGRVSAFERHTRERERAITYLKAAVAGLVKDGDAVLHGLTAHLIPQDMPGALRVCLQAGAAARLDKARSGGELNEALAKKLLKMCDERAFAWTETLSLAHPFEETLYHLVLHTDSLSPEDASAKIHASAQNLAPMPPEAKTALDRFLLAAETEAALANKGHVFQVEFRGPAMVLTTCRPARDRESLQKELGPAMAALTGGLGFLIETAPGAQGPPYSRLDTSMPGKVLLVDCEQESVKTLNDKLTARGVGCAVVYDGMQAVNFCREDPPEILVLNAGLPDMPGAEVLRLLRKENPGLEVVVLAGPGQCSGPCAEQGAFVCLDKPVDVESLLQVLVSAHKKIRTVRQTSLES